ncbi:MAG: ArgE/DapE family deacylase [Candidatus Aenigmarchaeota archaeon]|nr:ArgE/DapE family deacylase [Candidatus Aenigmarchaeota archaeon]
MDMPGDMSSEKTRKELVKLLGNLISKDTTNPPGNEWRAAEVVKKFFEKYRIKYKIFEKEKGRTNIIGYIGCGKPRLLIACHMDVVPPGKGWKTNPFKAVVKGDRIYGRGAVDDKGPLASSLIAGKFLKKIEKNLKGQVILACVADEERGSKYGMYYLLKEKKIHADYAIVPDIPHNMKFIDIGEKGLLFIKVKSLGKQAHGSRPEKGVNAIWNMTEFLNLLRKYKMKYRKNVIFSDPTINLGVISGGNAPNIVPAECEVMLDIRYLPGQKSKDILKDMQKLLKKAKRVNKKMKFKLEVIDDQPPVEIDRNNVLIKAIKRNTKRILGFEPRVKGMSGTTIVKPLSLSGITAVGFSAGSNIAHISNEWVSINELINFSKVLYAVSVDLIGK